MLTTGNGPHLHEIRRGGGNRHVLGKGVMTQRGQAKDGFPSREATRTGKDFHERLALRPKGETRWVIIRARRGKGKNGGGAHYMCERRADL